jgi:hypothetical protein
VNDKNVFCIGRPLIQILAKEGSWQSDNGGGLVAADELLHQDPYEALQRETARAEAAEKALKGMDKIGPWFRSQGLSTLDQIADELSRLQRLLIEETARTDAAKKELAEAERVLMEIRSSTACHDIGKAIEIIDAYIEKRGDRVKVRKP